MDDLRTLFYGVKQTPKEQAGWFALADRAEELNHPFALGFRQLAELMPFLPPGPRESIIETYADYLGAAVMLSETVKVFGSICKLPLLKRSYLSRAQAKTLQRIIQAVLAYDARPAEIVYKMEGLRYASIKRGAKAQPI